MLTQPLTRKNVFVRLLKGCIVSDDDVEEVQQDTKQTTIQRTEAYKRVKHSLQRGYHLRWWIYKCLNKPKKMIWPEYKISTQVVLYSRPTRPNERGGGISSIRECEREASLKTSNLTW
jgi:hypothetical protein